MNLINLDNLMKIKRNISEIISGESIYKTGGYNI